MNLKDLSKNIYVINLKERTDRREHIESKLSKIGCDNYKIIDAVDGSKIINKSTIKNGAYGLLMTYKNIFNDWNGSENDILIIEDDCLFINEFNSHLESYIKSVPSDWDMLYFGANHNYHGGMQTLKINDKCVKLNNSYSAHCVLMKPYVFKELINKIDQQLLEVDVLMSQLQKKYNSYSSHIALTTQIPSYSNIEDKSVDYGWLIK